jgi:hypothetical protein
MPEVPGVDVFRVFGIQLLAKRRNLSDQVGELLAQMADPDAEPPWIGSGEERQESIGDAGLFLLGAQCFLERLELVGHAVHPLLGARSLC